jgi:hypothetical protein
MENPKVVGRYLFSVIGLTVALALIGSILIGEWSLLLWTLAGIAVFVAGCAVVSLVFAITFGPLLWLLSRLCGKGPPAKR